MSDEGMATEIATQVLFESCPVSRIAARALAVRVVSALVEVEIIAGD